MIEHTWQEATCEEPKQCTTCGFYVGYSKGHSWKPATCDKAKYCTTCAQTEGEPLGHHYKDGVCRICGSEEQQYRFGDADGDGEVGYMDALLVLRFSVGLAELDAAALAVADVDGNGVVDYMDAMKILRASVGLEKL